MSFHVTSSKDKLYEVSSRYVRLVQVRSCKVRLSG
jgi:hypothetical protein